MEDENERPGKYSAMTYHPIEKYFQIKVDYSRALASRHDHADSYIKFLQE